MALYIGGTKVKLNVLYGDYAISGGKLLWANPDLYIASTGNPSINTGYICNTKTKVECVFSLLAVNTYPPSTNLFGTGGKYGGTNIFAFSCFIYSSGKAAWWPYIGNSSYGPEIPEFNWSVGTKYKIIMNGKEEGPQELFYASGELIKKIESNYNYAGSNSNLLLFSTNGSPLEETAKKKIYSFKIYESDVLLHNFVPVPKGLQIGSFVVPSNGMFDIVEQKFYANRGTGEFEYGRDK